MLTLEILIN